MNPVGESEPRSIVFNPICAQSTSGLKRTTLSLSNGGGTSMSLTPTQASTVSTTLSGRIVKVRVIDKVQCEDEVSKKLHPAGV